MMADINQLILEFLQQLACLPLEFRRPEIQRFLKPCLDAERKLRVLFAQDRENPILDDLHLGLIDPFSLRPEVLRSRPRPYSESYTGFWKLRDRNFPRSVFPNRHLMPLEPHLRREPGARAIVADLQSFRNNWELFTQGALDHLSDWSNIVVAGGSVLGCLSPPELNLSNVHLNDYYQSNVYRSSDIDIFLYGLTVDEARLKMEYIYESILRSLPWRTVCVRRVHTITIYSHWPNRPIQIIMRLYKSPAEMLAGFNIDSACCLFDGKNVYVNARALAALVCQSNTVDMSRRSPAYELRLCKYSPRGFEIYFPDLCRLALDSGELLNKYRITFPKGLAFIVVVEFIQSNPRHFLALYNPLVTERKAKKSDFGNKRSIDFIQVARKTYKANNYEYLHIPFEEEVTVKKITKMVKDFHLKDRGANSTFNPANLRRRLHRHAAICGTMYECLSGDFCPECPQPISNEEITMVEKETMYFHGSPQFIVNDPGRQMMTGSFYPIDTDDWTADAYRVKPLRAPDVGSDNDDFNVDPEYIDEVGAVNWIEVESDCKDATLAVEPHNNNTAVEATGLFYGVVEVESDDSDGGEDNFYL